MKKIIKLLLLWLECLICPNNKSKVLYYHDIFKGKSYKSLDTDVLLGTSCQLFEKHITIINQKGYKIVPQISREKNELSIMFDDGFRGIWDNRHFFYNNKICPTVFLAVNLIGKPGFLTVDEIKELQNHGFIFQCHSWSHRDLSSLNAEELKKELGDSKAYLSQLLQKDVSELCLPLGYFSRTLLEELPKYGYKKVYSSIPGSSDEKIFNILETRNLCQFANEYEFRLILRGGLNILKKRLLRLHYKRY